MLHWHLTEEMLPLPKEPFEMVNGDKLNVRVLNNECLELRQGQSASLNPQQHVHHVSSV